MQIGRPTGVGIAVALLAAVLLTDPELARAQDTVRINFDPGATGTIINGTITGNEYVDYVVNARGGQKMKVSLTVTASNGHGSAYFNILPAGQDYGGPYIGSTDDDHRAEVRLPHDGDWAIRVYLMGNDRDTSKTVGYSIDISISASDHAGSDHAGEPGSHKTKATGRAHGGSDRMVVTGIAANDVLNVRSGPGTRHEIIGALGNDDQVRRLHCEDHGGARWCKIEMLTDMREKGWVNARYLEHVR